MSNQLDFVNDCPFKANNEGICPYYGKTCECDEDEQEVCDLFAHYKDNMKKLLDTRAIKPEKYEELREQDFDTWLTTILHDIIEQVNFDASEVEYLGGAVWNGECPDGTPYPKVCAREDAYIQCIRVSNRLDKIENQQKTIIADLDELHERLCVIEEHVHNIMEFFATGGIKYTHYGKDFCGNCIHCARGMQADDIVYVCGLSHKIVDPDDASCAMYQDSYVDTDSVKAKLNSIYGKKVSNQLDKLSGKPDREECKHCPKAQCDNCMGYPF